MRHQSRDRYEFVRFDKDDLEYPNYKLLFNNKYEGYKTITHTDYTNLFYCCTPKGNSLDFYNMHRCKEHLLHLYMKDSAAPS